MQWGEVRLACDAVERGRAAERGREIVPRGRPGRSLLTGKGGARGGSSLRGSLPAKESPPENLEEVPRIWGRRRVPEVRDTEPN